MIFITGGCGFIGSNFVLDWLAAEEEPIIVLDKLTYSGNSGNLNSIKQDPRFHFIQGDINNQTLVAFLLEKYQPRAILNFAAESHVDRSIHNASEFIKTNICGTFCLLETVKAYWLSLNHSDKAMLRFLQVSTDEVYGSLQPHDVPFTESSPYSPNNPYSASKAAADHLVRAYYHTYGLPTLITNCSNNYGPYQFPEKLIPFTILNALQEKPLLIYGDGLQIRDWLYVSDHCAAIRAILAAKTVGETYHIGGNNEKTNLAVVQMICAILNELRPNLRKHSYDSLIVHIDDRPGHDRRYAVDATKIQRDLHWMPTVSFESGIRKTIAWYLNNMSWISQVNQSDFFQTWLTLNYPKMRETV